MSYDTEVAADSPVMYLKLNELSGTLANDSSAGGTNDGTYSGSPTLGADGPFGAEKAVQLDGTDDHVSVTLGASVTGDWTVECWAYLSAAGSYPMMVTGNGFAFDLRFDSNTRRPSGGFITSPDAVALDTWHHIVLKNVSGTGTLYVDKVIKATGSNTVGDFSVVNIGRRSDGFGFLQGRLAKVAIYDTALADARVEAHYDAAFAVDPTLAIDRTKVLTGASGTVTLDLTGTDTAWDGTTVFALSGTPPTGWSVNSYNVTSATTATITLNRGTGTGTLTIVESVTGTAEDTVEATNTASTINTGNWATASIWDTLEVPGADHNATITGSAGSVTVAANATITTLTVNDNLSVASGITFTVKGDVTVGNCAFDSGSGHLVLDATSTDRKVILGTAINQTSCYFKATGSALARGSITKTGSNEVWFDGADEGTGSGSTNTTGYDLRYCDITGIGKADGSFAFRSNSSGSHDIIALHCTFDGCATFFTYSIQWSAAGNKNLRIEDCTFENSISGSENIDARLSNDTGTGTRSMLRNVFDKYVQWGMTGAEVEDNAFLENVNLNGAAHGTWERNLVVQRSGSEKVSINGSMTDCYHLADHTLDGGEGNPHFIAAASPGGYTFDGIIFEYPHAIAIDGGDPIHGALGSSTIVNVLILPSETDGYASGNNIVNPSTEAGHNYNVTVEHCTIVGIAARIAFHETPIDNAPDFASIKSNLISAPSGTGDGRAAVIYDNTTPPTDTDPVTPVNATANYLYNPLPYTHPVSGLTHDGFRCLLSDEPTGNILDSTTGPQFVDATRNFANWSVYKGAANGGDSLATRIAASRALIAANPLLIGSDLIPWVRAGFAPQNSALDGTAHDAGTIGAVAFQAAGSAVPALDEGMLVGGFQELSGGLA